MCDNAAIDAKVTLVVSLSIHAGREAEFEQFESAAARIMRRYGGRIERRIRSAASAEAPQPYEFHVVTFPDEESLGRYRSDTELKGLAELRARAIRDTTVWRGIELPPFD